jgi:hypothetical protein
MSDIEVRERLRREIRKQVAPTAPANSYLTLVAFAIGAGVVAFALFLLVPQFLPQQPGSLPTLKDVKARIEAKVPATAPAQGDLAVANPARYEGKSPEEVGKFADGVCLQRTQARYPNWTKIPRLTAKAWNDYNLDDINPINELAQCLITEAPGRFCASADRNMLSAEIVHYFLAVAHLKRVLEKISSASSQVDIRGARAPAREIHLDPKVIAAIEARLNEGYLTAANRDQFNASVPSGVRERFAGIKPREPACMEKPWWAFWR